MTNNFAARLLLGLLLSSSAIARGAEAPQPVALPPAITAPQDVPYPGEIHLTIDATDVTRHIFRGRESIPVAGPGPMTLLFARWIPGAHSPVGALEQFVGLVITAGGRRVEWMRDEVEVAAFHVTVPAGATQLDLEFQFASAARSSDGRIVMTPDMLNLQWESMLLYPAGHFARQITVASGVKLPAGWTFATSLETAAPAEGVVRFKPVTLTTLVDSPLFAGRYFKQLDLDPGAAVPVRLNIVADKADLLDVTPAQRDIHRALVQQAYQLYGSRHYDHYDFLLALTENLGDIGMEHHRSSENSVDPKYFTDWEHSFVGRDLLAHEFTHSWNGKFRRPADLWTPNFNVPMRDSLLWVYEGQTQYWGYVLAARSGLLTKPQTLDALAETAAAYDHMIGRTWRALQDTTNDPTMVSRRPISWRSWQRSEDYYSEGELIWLDADTLIRELTRGAKSLDNFARAFFGVADGAITPVTYEFADVVKALNAVSPHDWAAFLRSRLDGHGPGAPLDGLKRGGYQLIYNETQSD
jgi:predicted metalloprotease with PDZ domain